jgi:alcohol dehydrogenase class IV
VIEPFDLGRLPRIVFGPGTRVRLPELAASYGRRILLVSGAQSLRASVHGRALYESFQKLGLEVHALAVQGEPSPRLVDATVREHAARGIDAVVGIGGGSALDAAKAIAGLLPTGRSIMDHLEEVGRGIPYEGPGIPLIAAPTTAGTGSEATRNAVVSDVGPKGFKRSFRHEALVAQWAVVDPDLLETCPRALVAADGLDALTQLLESYVSPRANAFTSALAVRGLAAVREGLLPWYEASGDPRASRSAMAFAALTSGITLAHAGLGIVHGLSAPLGAGFPIPHGVACGTLLAAATATNVQALRARDPEGAALARYGRAWAVLSAGDGQGREIPIPANAPELLVELLEVWTRRLEQPRLAAYGVDAGDVPRIVAGGRGGSTKTNPVTLSDEEMANILRSRL